jgi:polyketide biosynthesis enoyl-CoA hydratase PksH
VSKDFQTLAVRRDGGVCRVRLDRPAAGNAIDARMAEEWPALLDACRRDDGPEPVRALVVEGGPEVFCVGGDMAGGEPDAALLYDVWRGLAEGPFVSLCLVRGRVNAGGIGFVAACDLVLAERGATFALSELLFGLFPACVAPFFIRRAGARAFRHMSLATRPFTAEEALGFGLVDAVAEDGEALLRGHLQRLARLDRRAIARFKAYMAELDGGLAAARAPATAANRALFADPVIRRNLTRYAAEMKFPWEP